MALGGRRRKRARQRGTTERDAAVVKATEITGRALSQAREREPERERERKREKERQILRLYIHFLPAPGAVCSSFWGQGGTLEYVTTIIVAIIITVTARDKRERRAPAKQVEQDADETNRLCKGPHSAPFYLRIAVKETGTSDAIWQL